ncbi:hypothetical protein CROQUDRAFT_39087 [Cronartium quercuum f. sp. fusiforme G11]|uniref:DAGKc domain-containing protein n=1 Tax=Cronartium quercuum f. sp. fusiforme G11 TaxID=708437 RepID=A0A9P6NMS4_9BASI|nr:hypothetical protein CROQUDRAFT_39087 [Cronartium quercuum f. sp. fusiforme G11]
MNATSVSQRDYLFYVLPSSGTVGGLCWLEPKGPNEVIEPRPHLPQLVTAPPSHQALNIVSENVIPFVKAPDGNSSAVEWHILWNPAAGRGVAKTWLETLVLPLLTFAGVRCKVHESVLPSDASAMDDRLYEEVFGPQPQVEPTSKPKVIILGGDGTTSDFLNRVVSYDSGVPIVPSFELVILPLGTANALFFSTHPSSAGTLNQSRVVLTSLLLALFSTTVPPTERSRKPVPLAHVRISDGDQKLTHQAVAHVVASTALHASILHTADELRDSSELEGSARFQEAFQRNKTRLWDANLHLLPIAKEDNEGLESIFRYERDLEKLVKTSDPQGELLIQGGFSYFVSCFSDRLEKSFVIAPMRSVLSTGYARSLDVIVIRPKRDARLKDLDTEALGDASAAQVSEVMKAAYQSGSHLQLTFQDGQPVVEYFRCGGWRWAPTSSEQEVCIDGKLMTIPEQGSVECIVISNAADLIHIW